MNFENYIKKYYQPLSIENLIISYKNLPISLFDNVNNENNIKIINLIFKILILYSKIVSENLIINIEFNENNLPKKCSFYQKYYTIFYSLINIYYKQNQKILLKFPQIFQNNNFNTENYEKIEFDLLSSKITIKKKEFNINFSSISQILSHENIIKNINNSKLLNEEIFTYNYICFAGTFDYLHIGHNILIQMSLLLSKNKIGIGICSDEMIKKKSPKFLLESSNERLNNMKKFIEKNGLNNNQNVFYKIITDSIDFAGIDKNLECLVLTEETFKGGEIVNEIRIKNNINKIKLICLNVINNNDNNENNKVSSSFIRNEILNKISIEKLEKIYEKFKFLIENVLNVNNINFFNHWWSILLINYTKPYKYYHSLEHIKNCIELYEKNKHLIKENIQKEFLIALWFHDIIYYPGNSENEKKSAKIVEKFCKEINNNLNVNIIKKFIIETRNHMNEKNNDDDNFNLFLDIDMSVVGQDDYDEYENNIKNEYLNVYELEDYKIGRIEFLKCLLNKKKIFRTEKFFEMYENKARINIKKGIKMLEE